MDNSQSSDCFPENDDTSFMSSVPMDTTSYESLVAATKQALSSSIRKETLKSTFSTYFTSVLEDCSTCIIQNLELVTELLLNTEVCINKLVEYLNDAILILQKLSDFIKIVIESVSLACCSMKTFPAATGQIIIAVFTHCKDSESLYGNNLGSVEKQLKDLFRNCHELQLTYLMILEKHFIFNLTEKEEKAILTEVLDINLKIGEIVQSLDVKTMAEQWKAYTMICEKYSAVLSDTNVFQECTQVLCALVKNNMNMAVEKNQDEKVTMRSLKVASFTIKILLKMCNIFRNATRKDYANVLELIGYLEMACLSHLGMTAEMSQFTNLIVIPSESLLKELLSDGTFGNTLLDFNVVKIKNEEISLGFLLTIISVMKCLTKGHGSKNITKPKLINCVYNILPHCQIWSKQDFTPKSEPNHSVSHGLFEHLLIHTTSLAFTLDSEEFSVLERNMAEAILGTDCCTALFSANLWVLMARHVNSQLLFNQLVWLCTMHKKLESHRMFHRSPQKLHLSYTIGGLFLVMENDDKVKICKQFRIHDDDNVSLWTALRVNSLPEEMRCSAEDAVVDKLRSQFQCLRKGPDGIDKLIKVIGLAATCTFTNTRGIEDSILKAWSKTCPKDQFAIQVLDSSTVWFYDYLQALVSLTDSMWDRVREKSSNLIKILHIISSLIQQCSPEIKMLLTNILCKLATCDCEIKRDTNYTEAFSCLFQDSEDIVRDTLLTTLKKYKRDRNLDKILSCIEDYTFQESWSNIKDAKECSDSDLKATDFKYSHKCFENRVELRSSNVSELIKVSSSNFDFADIHNLFDKDCDTEPATKKVKLNSNEAATVIKRLETDATLLCNMKENVFTAEYKIRIQSVCDTLSNIIH